MLRRRADAGFTLVELLVTVSLLGVVLAAVAGLSIVAVGTAASADARLDESNDLLRAAGYFGDDVQGAQAVTVGTAPKCGTDPRAVVELVGQDFTDDSTFTVVTTVVSYVLRTGGDPGPVLHRLACTAPGTAPTYPLVPVSDVPVVRSIGASAPTAGCGTAGCAAFSQVDLRVQEGGGLRYTLTGRRRTTP